MSTTLDRADTLSPQKDGVQSPRRVQMTRSAPWRTANPEAVIVARPRYWGNPWAVRPSRTTRGMWAIETEDGYEDIGTRAEAIAVAVAQYRQWRQGLAALGLQLERLAELRGRDLACWCSLDQPCHADVLLELANADEPAAVVHR